MTFHPPLAYGGHEFVFEGSKARCWSCGRRCPKDSLGRDGDWRRYVGSACPNKLGRTPRRPRPKRPEPPAIEGQLSIYDVLEDS